MTAVDTAQFIDMSPKEFRALAREDKYRGSVKNACRGYVVANLAIIPEDVAFEFSLFCNRNPKPCPVLEIGDPGDPYSKIMAPGADIRADLTGYTVLEHGKLVDAPSDIKKYWRDDFVFFLLGCSLSFEWALDEAGIQYHGMGAHKTGIECVPAGRFRGHIVATRRIFKDAQDAIRATEITSRYPAVHGGPIYMGDSSNIGIDLSAPILEGQELPRRPVLPKPGEVVLHWACGITPQVVAQEIKLPILIAHGVACLFVTDWRISELADWADRTVHIR